MLPSFVTDRKAVLCLAAMLAALVPRPVTASSPAVANNRLLHRAFVEENGPTIEKCQHLARTAYASVITGPRLEGVSTDCAEVNVTGRVVWSPRGVEILITCKERSFVQSSLLIRVRTCNELLKKANAEAETLWHTFRCEDTLKETANIPRTQFPAANAIGCQ